MSEEQVDTPVTEASPDADRRVDPHPADDLLVPPDADVDPRLSVVMPTRDEADAVAECITRAKDAIHELGITAEIVVSDSSADSTPDIARAHGAIVVTPDEEGYGAAYRHAFRQVRGEYVVMGDADTTYDFRGMPELLSPLVDDDADLVLGSRLAGDIEPGAMPLLHRHVGNPLLTGFLNLFYDADVTDAHSGFRAFRTAALDELDLQANGMEFASEMIMQGSLDGLAIAEVPITYHRRQGEAKLDTFHDGWRHVRFMLVNAPGYLFSVPGLAMAALGVVFMLVTYSNLELFGVDLKIHSMIAGSLLTIVGYQVSSLGVFATVAGDPMKRPGDPLTTWIAERSRLEHGATLGVALVVAGGSYAALALLNWIRSGFSQLPLVMADMLAFTAIVLGLQTVFASFFMSVLGDAE